MMTSAYRTALRGLLLPTDWIRRYSLLAVLLAVLAADVYTQTVYITRTGSKYHTAGCRYLRRSSISVDLKTALSQGYGPCSVCRPPAAVEKREKKTDMVRQTGKGSETNRLKPGVAADKQALNENSLQKSVQCSAITKKGTRCRRMTRSPDGLCWQHKKN
jgi:hypothetical protein